eukprot:14144638-Alexandrium_andersonii.AAC.1
MLLRPAYPSSLQKMAKGSGRARPGRTRIRARPPSRAVRARQRGYLAANRGRSMHLCRHCKCLGPVQVSFQQCQAPVFASHLSVYPRTRPQSCPFAHPCDLC